MNLQVYRSVLALQFGISAMAQVCKKCRELRRVSQLLYMHQRALATSVPETMKVWQTHQYGTPADLTLSTTARVPVIKQPNDLLIKVHAASVNPVDTLMLGGYGSAVLNQLRRVRGASTSEFPLTLGRDFAGEVVQVGRGPAAVKYKPGDKVWGALAVHAQGTHGEYIIATPTEVSPCPKNLTMVEAASVPYVAVTAWTALCRVGEMTGSSTPGKRVLILGGAGGVGTFAIQLMKAWGAEVTTTCSVDASGLVISLGADVVVDYKSTSAKEELTKLKGFDLILDCVGGEAEDFSLNLLKSGTNAKYVSIKTPLMNNVDTYGLPLGAAASLADLGLNVLKGFSRGRSYRWAFFMPDSKALCAVARMVQDKQIVPVIDKVYNFKDLPAAYEKVKKMRGRGKSVIDFDQNSTTTKKTSDSE